VLGGKFSRLGLGIFAFVFVIDRINKYWLVEVVDLSSTGPIEITNFFDLIMVWNRGISYGLFQQDGILGRYFLVFVSILLSSVLLVWLERTTSKWTAVSLGCILGGALSNPVDRLVWGAVADFYRLHGFGLSWYVFNIADVAIVVGAVILLYLSFVSGHKSVENHR